MNDAIYNRRVSILVLGYSPSLQGGVTKVTDLLLESIPGMQLHPVLYCYKPRYKSIFKTVVSYITYIHRLVFNPSENRIVFVIVGSPGDAVRTLPFIWAAKLFGKKICIQYHKSTDIILKGITTGLVKRVLDHTYKKVDVHAFLSNNLAEIHRKLLNKNINAVIIPNALSDKWIHTEQTAFSSRDHDIVFFGRWSWEKGVDDLILAMNKINADAVCEIYTNTKPESNFERCIILPWVNEEEVYKIMKSAKLLVLPSYSEAFPTVLLEAIACGTPFIASNIAGIPDIASESGAGMLIEPGDTDDLAAKIDQLLLDREIWEKYSNNGLAWIKKLDINSITSKWNNTFAMMANLTSTGITRG